MTLQLPAGYVVYVIALSSEQNELNVQDTIIRSSQEHTDRLQLSFILSWNSKLEVSTRVKIVCIFLFLLAPFMIEVRV